jgi:peroxiredoxin
VVVALAAWIWRLTARLRAREARPVAAPSAAESTGSAASSNVQSGRPVGSLAPDFALADLDGAIVTLASLLTRGKPVLLVFSDPGCGPCARLIPRVADRQAQLGPFVTFAVISRGTPDAHKAVTGPKHVLLQRDREVMADYQVVGTPTAVLINADGTIGSTLAPGELNIARILDDFERQIVAEATLDVAADSVAAPPAPTLTPLVSPMKADCVHDELLPDGSVVLYNACRRHALTLNATAALIWECCDGNHRADAIADVVREVFPSAPNAVRDVLALLQQLGDAGMITISTLATVE